MKRIAIIGAAGAIGRNLSPELSSRGIPHRVIGRDQAKLEKAFGSDAEIAPADIGNSQHIAEALASCDAAVYAVGLPYPEFDQHPVLMRKALVAARTACVERMAVVSSVYGYGRPRTPRVAEDHPREPEARKGKARKQQEDAALEADTPALRTLVLRLPDFYGPNAELSLADLIYRAALAGRTANWLGSPDLPHEFVYVPDAAPVLLDLMAREDSYGQAWNFGGPGTIAGREFINVAYTLSGRKPKFRAIGPLMLRLGGLFNPMLRELVELQYLAETPVILDDSKLERHLGGLRKTPYLDGIRASVEWYKRTHGSETR